MIKKQYIKSRQVSKVTFALPRVELPKGTEAESVHLVGDFNDWDVTATPMNSNKLPVNNELDFGELTRFVSSPNSV